MYCSKCNESVEVNSVNIDDKIVNVCKHCGESEYLKDYKDKDPGFDPVLMIWIVLGFVFVIWFLSSLPL